MSKSSHKNRYQKEPAKHNFRHLENAIKVVTPSKGSEQNNKTNLETTLPLSKYINNDLRKTGTIIGLFILTIVALGILMRFTSILKPALKLIGIEY